MTSPGAPRRRAGLVVVLLVGVVLAAVLAVSVVRWMGDDRPPSATDPSSGAPASARGQASTDSPTGSSGAGATASERRVEVRSSDGWTYEIPRGKDWTAGSDVLAYADRSGRVLVQATSPSYFRADACDDPHSVARGVLGWSTPAAGSTSGEVVRNWAHAVASRDDGSQRSVGAVKTETLTHPSLMAEHSTALVRMDKGRNCLPQWIEVSATSYREPAGQESRVLVMLREVDGSAYLTPEVKKRVLTSVRRD